MKKLRFAFPITQSLYHNTAHHPLMSDMQFQAMHELEKRVESLIDWLRMVSLMGQLNKINVETIRAAIASTNWIVETG